ncbi:MAG: hypothetical protein AAFX54_15310 [Pseudomonadota bacterium]
MTDHNHQSKDKGWADNPTFIRIFLGVLIGACVLSAFAGFVTSWHNPHPHFSVEGFPIFFAVWGFAAFTFIVLAGQHLRKLVGRKEEYYDERE